MLNLYRKLPNAWKAGFNTAWQASVGTFLLTIVGFLSDIAQWAGETESAFPAVTPLGKAVVSLAAGLTIGAITVIYRSINPGPVYPSTPPPAGAGSSGP